VDEGKLAEVFRDAAGDAPPASFDKGDILAASARATARARQRVRVGAGIACGFVLLAGIGVTVANLTGPTSSTANAPAVATGGRSAPSYPLSANGFPGDSSGQGHETPGTVDPRVGHAPAGCGAVDRGLADALVDELPAAAGGDARAADSDCPAGSIGAGYQVNDGANSGMVSVIVVPASVSGQVKPFTTQGTQTVTVKTRSGGTLTLVSRPMNDSAGAPFGGQLKDIAARLQARY
jgi:hypothetical protein